MKKQSPLFKVNRTIATLASFLMFGTSGLAQTVYMDVNGPTSGFGDYASGVQVWSTALSGPNIWSSNSEGTSPTGTYESFGSITTVIFNRNSTSGVHEVSLAQSVTIDTLQVIGRSDRFTLSAASTGTVLNVSVIDLTQTTGGTLRINDWHNGNLSLSGPFTINGRTNSAIQLYSSYTGGLITLNTGSLHSTTLNTEVHFSNSDSRVIDSSNEAIHIGSISGSGIIRTSATAANRSYIRVNQTTDRVFSGNLSNSTSGNGSMRFIKEGSATLTLTGINTYNGETTVSAGALLINTELTNTTSVTVASNARIGGSGSTTDVTIQSGGTLGATNFIDSLSLDNLTLSANAVLSLDLNLIDASTIEYDHYQLNGNFALDAGNTVTLSLNLLGEDMILNAGTVLTLASYSGDRLGGLFTYSGNVLYEGDTVLFGRNRFLIHYGNPAGNSTITLTAIPEGSTIGLMLTSGLSIAVLCVIRRRKPLIKSGMTS